MEKDLETYKKGILDIPFKRYYKKYNKPSIKQYFNLCSSITTVIYGEVNPITYVLCAETTSLYGWIYVLERPGNRDVYQFQGRICAVNGDLKKSGWSGSFQEKYPYIYDIEYLEKELKNKFFDYLVNKEKKK